MEPILQVGIGGIFALLVIREVFTFIKSQRNGNASNPNYSKDLTVIGERLAIESETLKMLLESERSERETAQAMAATLTQVAKGLELILGSQGRIERTSDLEEGRRQGRTERGS